jgi:hypothetical protein
VRQQFERWIHGDPNRKLVTFAEGNDVIVSEVTVACDGPGTPPQVYRRDRLVLTQEEAQWLSWALDQISTSAAT